MDFFEQFRTRFKGVKLPLKAKKLKKRARRQRNRNIRAQVRWAGNPVERTEPVLPVLNSTNQFAAYHGLPRRF